MSRWILRLLLLCLAPCALIATGEASARTATLRAERVTTAVATLDEVVVRLEWPAQDRSGRLTLEAGRVEAPDLGYVFDRVRWQCPLLRDGRGGWRCDGIVRSGTGTRPESRLSVELATATTDVALTRHQAAVELHRSAATPDLTTLDLRRVPLAWTQALLAQPWPEVTLTGGTIDAALAITAADGEGLRVAGPVALASASLDTPDGSIAAEDLGAKFQVEASFGESPAARVEGALEGGELLFGTTYISLGQRTVGMRVEAEQDAARGWRLPRIGWNDPGMLAASGSAAFTGDGALWALDVSLQSDDLAPLRDAYLSGWLGTAGLAQLQLKGAAAARVRLVEGQLHSARVELDEVALVDPEGRFGFDGMDGDIAFSSTAPVASRLGFRGGSLYGLAFGAGMLDFSSDAGELRLDGPFRLPMLGGELRFDGLRIRPPTAANGLVVGFGLTLDDLDVGQLSQALDWPDFKGSLSGHIPEARYASERLEFGGGLEMRLFGGSVAVSSLAMERPFGIAPTLSADIVLDDLDLESLTGVFGFGSVTGTLDGTIAGLRLVDWSPTAFDAQLRTQRKRGVRQRISQRAVQDLSSVGDPTFAATLQAQLLGVFDDFGYSRIGVSCRLRDEVCSMDGLGSAGAGFLIVEGAGLPHLDVVGFNRQVDWPTLVERLAAVGSGDVTPVVE